PYPWLANIRVRQNNPLGALAAGAKGIALQPDLPEAHYFSGGLSYMLAEYPDVGHDHGLQCLIEAVRLQPKFHPAWIVAGALAIYLGKYEIAIDLLKEAIRIEQEPDLQYRFEGARTLMGSVSFRLGDSSKSIQHHVEALQKLSRSEHIYGSTFRILSACGIGAIELRGGNPKSAISHYRLAWQTVKENPRIAGNARLQIRVGAGLAAAYAASKEGDRARELLAESHALLESVLGQYATVTFECSFGQLCLDLAVAERQMGNLRNAEKLVRRALDMRWKDVSWLSADPMLKGLYSDPGL
ncbi:MAG: tetratricopeptide repeat protein, partial [Saprospiraceae bacterium]